MTDNDDVTYEYFKNRRSDRTYISKSFLKPYTPDSPKMRIISKVFDMAENHEFVDVLGETVIRITPGEREEIKAVFYEDNRQIETLVFQRFDKRIGKPRKISFNFHGEEINKIIAFLHWIRVVQLQSGDKEKYDDEVILDLVDHLSDEEKKRVL